MWRIARIWGALLTSKTALKCLSVFWRESAEVNENQAPGADPSEVSLSLFKPPHPHPHTHTLTHTFTPSPHTRSSLPWQREEKTRKFNNAFERQDYLRRRRHCYATSEILCALLSVCSHYTPPSLHSSIHSTPLTWLKTALKNHIKTLLWCHSRQLTSGVQNTDCWGCDTIWNSWVASMHVCVRKVGGGWGDAGISNWGGYIVCLLYSRLLL